MHNEEANVVAGECSSTVEPHHEESALGVKAEAGEAAVEGMPVQEPLCAARSRSGVDTVRIDITPVLGVEQLELAATRIDVEDRLAPRNASLVGRAVSLAPTCGSNRIQ